MKKPVKRASLLEHVLSDFLEVEDILLKLDLKGELQPLTARQTRLYKEVAAPAGNAFAMRLRLDVR
jgi:hypothetical protein